MGPLGSAIVVDGVSKAAALYYAQLKTTGLLHSIPSYWAPFSLINNRL